MVGTRYPLRNYGLKEKRFSLFNSARWSHPESRPSCCNVVPVLYKGIFHTDAIACAIHSLQTEGSQAAPGFMNPEGIIIYHEAAGIGFKKTIKDDESPKSLVK